MHLKDAWNPQISEIRGLRVSQFIHWNTLSQNSAQTSHRRGLQLEERVLYWVQ